MEERIKVHFFRIFFLVILAGLFSISLWALLFYPGCGVLFVSFCGVYIFSWALAWFGYRSNFYILFSTFWLLGFWMKACSHLISGSQFVEPTGAFDGSSEAWDKAIDVALAAGVGMLLFRVSQMLLMRRHSGVCVVIPDSSYVPRWYSLNRRWIWAGALIVIVFIATINFLLGINQAGLLPKHHLPFKLNAIINWCLYSAMAFWLAAIVWWEACLGAAFRFEAIVFEGVLSSITIMSRSLYVTHVFHYALSVFFNRSGLKPTLQKYISMLFIFIFGMAVVLVSVAELRRMQFYGEPTSSVSKSSEHPKGRASPQFFLLLSERWIGLEGVMSTSSYSDVGIELFRQGWLDVPSYTYKPVYERVANSIYISPDYPNAGKYNFLSTPGLAAMLHLSGSLIVVGVGVCVLLALFSAAEYFIYRVLKNPFILSLYGMIGAMMLHQFGGLYVNLIQLFEIGSMVVFIWLVGNLPECSGFAKRVG